MTARNRRRAQGRDVPSLSLHGIAAAASGGARFPAPQDRRLARGPCTGSCTPAALGLRPDGPQGMRFLRRGRRNAQGRRTCRETGSFPVGRRPSPKRCLTACRGEAAVSLIYVKKRHAPCGPVRLAQGTAPAVRGRQGGTHEQADSPVRPVDDAARGDPGAVCKPVSAAQQHTDELYQQKHSQTQRNQICGAEQL